eukprot:7535656-Karenia_brevis.AAC.1
MRRRREAQSKETLMGLWRPRLLLVRWLVTRVSQYTIASSLEHCLGLRAWIQHRQELHMQAEWMQPTIGRLQQQVSASKQIMANHARILGTVLHPEGEWQTF